MNDSPRRVRPIIFAVALIALFLPLFAVSCQGTELGSATTIQLATGARSNDQNSFSPSTGGDTSQSGSNQSGGEPLAIFLIVVIVAGLGASFAQSRAGVISALVAGAVGLIVLLMLKAKIDDAALQQGGGVLQIDYRIGFYTLLLSMIAAIAFNAYSLRSQSAPFAGVYVAPQRPWPPPTVYPPTTPLPPYQGANPTLPPVPPAAAPAPWGNQQGVAWYQSMPPQPPGSPSQPVSAPPPTSATESSAPAPPQEIPWYQSVPERVPLPPQTSPTEPPAAPRNDATPG